MYDTGVVSKYTDRTQFENKIINPSESIIQINLISPTGGASI